MDRVSLLSDHTSRHLQVAEARKSFIYSPSISNEGAGAVELLTLSLCHHMNLRMKDVIDSEIM